MEISNIMRNLEHDFLLCIEWFENNNMKLNEDKCHFIFLGHKHEHIFIHLGNTKLWEENSVTLLGMDIDSDLRFNIHMDSLIKKADRKLTALIRLLSILSLDQRKTLMKAFIESQFNYCPLIWMFHSRGINNRVNNLHKRALRLTYCDFNSSFVDLLNANKSIKIHYKNIHKLAIEIFKNRNSISNDNVIINNQKNYNLRNSSDLKHVTPVTECYGKNSIRYLGPKIWEIVPLHCKNSSNLGIFKSRIKEWIPVNCPCRLCKHFIYGVGFL